MARRLKIPSLRMLTRSYEQGLRRLVRTTKAQQKALGLPTVTAPKKKRAASRAVAPTLVKPMAKKAIRISALQPVAPVRRVLTPSAQAFDAASPALASKKTGELGQWVSGIAPGPAGARRYHLYVPPGVTTSSRLRVPLLVMLHGCKQTGHDFAASTRMNQRAARERFIVLYPEQERLANPQGCWNWFDLRSGRASAEADTLLAAVDQVCARYPVHPERIAVAGLSAGATMAAWMALREPGRFCAVAVHSGAAPGSAASAANALAAMRGDRAPTGPATLRLLPLPSNPLATTSSTLPPPLIVLHGNADSVVALANARKTAAWWADSLQARVGATQVQQRGARYASQVTEWKARGKTKVVLRVISGLGHAWSGGSPRLPFSEPKGPDASALIWSFMARQFGRVQSAPPIQPAIKKKSQK